MKKLVFSFSIVLLLSSCKKEDRFAISRIKSVAKLATTETIIDKLIVGSKEKRIFGLVKVQDASFAASTQAVVKCGIDLNELMEEDVRIEGAKISLLLPHVRVLDFSYPFQSFKIDKHIFDDSYRNRFEIVDYETFYRKAEIDIRDHLVFMGIKEDTETKTRLMMQALLQNLGYTEIYITFKEGVFVETLNPNYKEYEVD